MTPALSTLVKKVRACTLCIEELEHGARPVLQVNTQARILVAGQAPGSKVHATGIPFDDPSGDRLRAWMGIDSELFYDDKKIALLPMGFCYPGKGKSGDLPPIPRCTDTWRNKLLNAMPNIQLTLVIGQYAQAWHLPVLKDKTKTNLTATVKNWAAYDKQIMPLPHPSPRNNIWLKKNPWFDETVIPALQQRVRRALTG